MKKIFQQEQPILIQLDRWIESDIVVLNNCSFKQFITQVAKITELLFRKSTLTKSSIGNASGGKICSHGIDVPSSSMSAIPPMVKSFSFQLLNNCS